MVASCNGEPEHLEKLICVGQNQIPKWGREVSQIEKSLSLEPSPWSSVVRVGETVSMNLWLEWIVHASFCGLHLWLPLAHE